jgi:hypothetical protein
MSRFNFIASIAPAPSATNPAPDNAPARPASPSPLASRSSPAEVSVNAEKNGVEIKFPGKPDADTLSKLKAAGWRWSFRSCCWYHKHTPENLAWAEALVGERPESPSPISQPANIIPLPPPSTLNHQPSTPAAMPAWRARLLRRPLSV